MMPLLTHYKSNFGRPISDKMNLKDYRLLPVTDCESWTMTHGSTWDVAGNGRGNTVKNNGLSMNCSTMTRFEYSNQSQD